jgi:hypothetical protein
LLEIRLSAASLSIENVRRTFLSCELTTWLRCLLPGSLVEEHPDQIEYSPCGQEHISFFECHNKSGQFFLRACPPSHSWATPSTLIALLASLIGNRPWRFESLRKDNYRYGQTVTRGRFD